MNYSEWKREGGGKSVGKMRQRIGERESGVERENEWGRERGVGVRVREEEAKAKW